jgi:hypothetical protein
MLTLRCALCAMALAFALPAVADPLTISADLDGGDAAAVAREISESDRPGAPADFGFGPGVRPPATGAAGPVAAALAVAPALDPIESPTAHIRGSFSPAFPWPIITIHMVLLPNGKVLSFGTRESGQQTGEYEYAVWDPARGTGAASHMVLPNRTGTDLFCAGQSVIPGSGEVLIAGGDMTIRGERNFSTADANLFNPTTNVLRSTERMAFPRWYPTVVPMANGEMFVAGGREDKDPIIGVPTPEVFRPGVGWRTLPGARSDPAYGQGGWYYPRIFPDPSGRLFVMAPGGRTFYVNAAGAGSITPGPVTLPIGGPQLPTLMFAPGRVLSVRFNRRVVIVNLGAAGATVVPTQDIDADRFWANATVLADGRVFVNGGSRVGNQLIGVSLGSQLWNPATGRWSDGAVATRARLYHSGALLLPDATVLTSGGGAPGPIRQLNAELYYPPYLFRTDGSGALAPRPTLAAAPAAIRVGSRFEASVGPADRISRVTVTRIGTATHAFNADQRFFPLTFTQTGTALTINGPANANIALPGWYMLFVFNEAGTPSVARIIRVTA